MPRMLPRATLLVALLGFTTAAFSCPDCRAALATRSPGIEQALAPHTLVLFVPFVLLGALVASLHRWPRRRLAASHGAPARAA